MRYPDSRISSPTVLGNAIVDYLRHQVAKRDPEGSSSRLRKILEHLTAEFSTPSLPGMPAFSVSLDVGMHLGELLRLFERSVIPGPAFSPREAQKRFLEALSADRRLVIHIVDPVQPTAIDRAWLIDHIKLLPNLVLVCSCEPEAADPIPPGAACRRLGLRPYTSPIRCSPA